MLRIVSATRHDPITFPRQTHLGRAVAQVSTLGDWTADVTYSNAAGLPAVYNAALARAVDSDLIAFVHDDVLLDPTPLPALLRAALARFAVVGVAGNRRRVPRQPSWAFTDDHYTWDTTENLSGAVGHGPTVPKLPHYYGETPAEVKLLDGLFLAAKVETLHRAGVTFDPRFTFHFYDLDFCRTCEQAGLTMGTWPIPLTHASGGRLGTPEWKAAYAAYLAKWGE